MSDLVTTYELILDTKNTDIKVLRVKQYDEGTRLIRITLLSNGEPMDLTDCEVAFKGCTPDDRVLLIPCEVYEGNKVDLDVSYNVSVIAGRVTAEMLIYNRDRLVSTMPFIIQVIPSAWDDDRLQGADEFSALTYLLVNAKKSLDEMIETNRIVQEAEEVRTASEEERVDNEETRVTNENVRIENENQRISNENARIDDESERQNNFEFMTDMYSDMLNALELEGFIFITEPEIEAIIANTYTDTSEQGNIHYTSQTDIDNIINNTYA